MGIFSRIFQRGQDGGPIDGRQDEQDSEEREAPPDGTPEQAETETDRTEPTPAPGHAMATAAAGAASPFSTPLWSWPQRSSDANARRESSAAEEVPTAPPTSATRQESPMAKPDDPVSPGSRSRSALPGVPKRASQDAPEKAPARPADRRAGEATTSAAPAPAAAASREKNDATAVMSPPPAPAAQRAATLPTTRATPAPRPAPATSSPQAAAAVPAPATAPAVATPVPFAAPLPDAASLFSAESLFSAAPMQEIDDVVVEIQVEPTGAVVRPPANNDFTVGDLEAVRSVFNDVAVAHVSQVRDVMLELRYGEADPKWIELTKPALRSLRAMAAQMEIHDLCEALDAFCAAVDAAVVQTARVTDENKAELQQRYARLIELIPQAFELDAERDRREPIIIEALLYQVSGVEQPTIAKLFAVGLGRLDALMNASAEEVAVVTGLRSELASAIVEKFRSYRASASTAVSAPDPAVELRHLGDLLIMLSIQNDDFTKASTEWADDAQQRKRLLRKQREQTFQQIKVTLARLGEREQIQRLEKLPFQDRIATLDRYLSSQQPKRPSI
jgi:hypothetical protein